MQKTSATNTLNYKRDYWPTLGQELLLRASLLQSNDAKTAWNDWKSAFEFDRLDTESNLLLSLLYTNLSRLKVKDPLMRRLKGIYRYNWYKNQLLFNKLSNLLHSFHKARIQTVILNGVVLTTLYSLYQGSRQIDKSSLMVHKNQASKAVNLILKMGWRTHINPPDDLSPHIHSIRFEDSHGWPLDLNFGIVYECQSGSSDRELWDAAMSTNVFGIPAMALSPTDQLMYVCIHGKNGHGTPSVQRVADAMMVINSSHSEIDWDRLINQTQKRDLILLLRDILKYLKEKLEAPVPQSVLESLDRMLASQMGLR